MVIQDRPWNQIEGCLNAAIEVAKEQKAKSQELRAVISLGRLLQKSGRYDVAREKLSDVYSWFTEGHDTPYLEEAKFLLEELRQQNTV